MDVSDIEMLEAIVRHGSINKASESLHVTQPTLSKRLGRLEYKLGTPLFLRSSSGLTPTAHTNFIIDSSDPIRRRLHNIERHIELMNALERGDLHLGVGPIVEQLYFPYALLRLTQSPSSQLNVSIRTETAAELKELVITGAVDVAVGPFEQSMASDEYEIFPIASQPLMVAARSGHAIATKMLAGELTQEDVLSQPLISPHMPDYMAEPFELLRRLNTSRIVCDNYSVIKGVLHASDYISLGPTAVFSAEAQEGSLVLMPLPQPITWFAACVARPESACLPVIQRVIETFREYELPTVSWQGS
ncbi:MAG: LysR family transcriptional regulator [Pseudomonadota bacterium]